MNRRIIFHIDVNSAYLSWEAAYRLQYGSKTDLRLIPSIVGGDPTKRHGIVLAKSIPAKEAGVKTGESIFEALQKCPDLEIVPPNYERYLKASNATLNILKEYSPTIQRYSIDEAFLDYSFGKENYLDIAYEIKERVKKELGFTVNIGIGPNKLLAKVASNFKKPDNVHTLFEYEIPKKMWPLPVNDLFMVGSRTKRKLNGRGIFTIGDLASVSRDYIYSWLKKPGLLIWEYANGIENSKVRVNDIPVKSVGNSTTTSFDVETADEAHKFLLAISEMIGIRIRDINQRGSVISVGIKDHEFIYRTHQRKLMTPTSSTNEIYRVARELFDEMWQGKPLRHLSINVSQLSNNDFLQLSMVEDYNEKEEMLDYTIDKIRFKYGNKSIFRSCFLHSYINPVIGGVIQEEQYPMMSSKF